MTKNLSKYKLVPVEPTPEMLNAPLQGGRFENRVDLRPSIYRAMLAAAPVVVGEPGVKWAPEEVANGNKGIRWVSDEGVHGRPTDHDCRVYLESNPNARGCHCPECTMLYTAPQPAPDVTLLVEALEEGLRAIGDHHAPGDCYATGPMTGDPFRDLVQCPACSFIAMCDDLLAAYRKQGGGE